MTRLSLLLAASLLLSACDVPPPDKHSDGDGDGGSGAYTIGGNVTGLVAGMSMTLGNGVDRVNLSANGAFAFGTELNTGDTYDVRVLVPPRTSAQSPAASCSVSNGNGTVATADIDSIVIACTDNVAPAAESVQVIAVNSPVVIRFDESMDTASVTLDGSLVAASDGTPVWSTTTFTNDTLTLNPATAWTQGIASYTLTVSGKDTAATHNTMPPLNATYDVYNTLYYVNKAMADDTGDGLSPATAKQTINTAITAASALDAVLVSAASYVVYADGSGTPGRINLKTGVSLYGGFNTTFTVRRPDKQDYWTHISDASSAPGSLGSPNCAMEGSSVSNLIIDGFRIGSGLAADANAVSASLCLNSTSSPIIRNNRIIASDTGNQCTGIYIDDSSPTIQDNDIVGPVTPVYCAQVHAVVNATNAAPLIQNNIIDGGASTSSTFGIFNLTGAAPVVKNNSIDGGSSPGNSYGIASEGAGGTFSGNTIYGGDNGTTNGLVLNNSAAAFYNNLIHGGTSDIETVGIAVLNSSTASIRNNTINGGSSTGSAYGIVIDTPPLANLDNNIIFIHSAIMEAYCIYDILTVDTSSIRNNNLYSCFNALYANFDGVTLTLMKGINSGNLTENADGSGAILATSSGNVSLAPLFVDIDGPDNNINTMADNDWRLTASSPAAVKSGGLNGIDDGGWGYTDDLDSVTRPGTGNPWAMGAYEP